MENFQSKTKQLIRDAMMIVDGQGSLEKVDKYFSMIEKYYLQAKKNRPNIKKEIIQALEKGIRAEYGVSWKLNIHTIMHWINSEINSKQKKPIQL